MICDAANYLITPRKVVSSQLGFEKIKNPLNKTLFNCQFIRNAWVEVKVWSNIEGREG
jgi:hypothetical protein